MKIKIEKRMFGRIFPLIALFIFISAFAVSQQVRIAGMGKLFLVIEDEDNNLNLYDKGRNSAFLGSDEPKDWLKINLSTISANGSLHRTFDPNGINFYDLHFEALKIIDENQTFKGIIEYSDHKRKDVYSAIQTQVYGSQPFMLFDSTNGNLDFYGPKLAFEYSILLVKDLALGVNFFYAGEKGIKNVYTKPEITNRYISGQLSLAYNLSEELAIGAKLDPFYNYEKIDMAKDPDTGSDPITYKYRGFKIIRKSPEDFTRYNKNKGFNIELQSHLRSLDSALSLYISAGYAKQSINCEDGTIEAKYEGYWQEDGFSGSLFARYSPEFISKNLTFGFGFDFRNMSSWSKHPLLPIVFSENQWKRSEISVGVSYEFKETGLIVGAEYYKTNCDTTLDDYLGNYYFDASNPRSDIRLGAELKVTDNFRLRAGFNYFTYDPDKILNEIKYNQNLYTFGASYLIENLVKLDLLINYGKKDSKDMPINLTYKETGAVLFAKFYVF